MKYKNTAVLALNCGSSSLKYRLVLMPDNQELISGEVERVGIKTLKKAVIHHNLLGKTRSLSRDIADHSEAFAQVVKLIKQDSTKHKQVRIDMLAHRYVHPGNLVSDTAKVNPSLIKKLSKTLEFAPIHNPVIFKMINKCLADYARIPQYVVFDTAFHKTIPASLATYGLPVEFTKKYHLKKMGFHGISHKYVMQKACTFLNKKEKTLKIISCHLGTGGASVCAIDKGKSINNSMGFTPLEGLIMNTRCGDVDLGLVFYVMFKENCSPDIIDTTLNKKSGLVGLFGASSDLRDIIEKVAKDPKAKVAFNMYVKRIKKYIGFYSLLLKKADVLIFTDSIGIESPMVREAVVDGFEFMGMKIDRSKNNSYVRGAQDISDPNSQTRILVVPTDEESMIAREAYKEFSHDIGGRRKRK